MLEIRDLCAGYGSGDVLRQVSLTAPAGAITVLVGPNGCGKSTLLKAIAGILPPHSGTITLEGRTLLGLPPRILAQQVAYLPQNRQVPEITAERLVLHGRFPYLSYPRRYRREDLESARRAMEAMGISGLAQRYMNTLSGGQRQKVYIAMALAQDTQVLLMDEPTTYLDVSQQFKMLEEAGTLARAGKTVLLVIHDIAMALKHADHLAVLHDGRILDQGDPETVFSGGCLEAAFGVRVERLMTEDGWQYYYRERK